MRAIVTCECCRHRQWLVRPIDSPESFHVICHRCERVLQVSVTKEHLAVAASGGPGMAFPAPEGPWPQPAAGIDGGGWATPLV